MPSGPRHQGQSAAPAEPTTVRDTRIGSAVDRMVPEAYRLFPCEARLLVMVTGAVLSGAAILGGAAVAAAAPGIRPFLEQPAAWTVPLAVLVTVVVSRADRRGAPRGTDAFLTRLHVPERNVR